MKIEIIEQTTLPVVQLNIEDIAKGVQYYKDYYAGLIFEEKDVTQGKKDLAELNKVAKALSDMQKKIKDNILKSVEVPLQQLEGFKSEILTVRSEVEQQINVFIAAEKAEKMELINKIIASLKEHHGIEFDVPVDTKWLAKDKNEVYITACVDNILMTAKLEQEKERILANAKQDRLLVIQGMIDQYANEYGLVIPLSVFDQEEYTQCPAQELETALRAVFQNAKDKQRPAAKVARRPAQELKNDMPQVEQQGEMRTRQVTLSYLPENSEQINSLFAQVKKLCSSFEVEIL